MKTCYFILFGVIKKYFVLIVGLFKKTKHLRCILEGWIYFNNGFFKVLDLAFDSVGARLAAAEGNGHVQVWDVRKNADLLYCLSGHTCEVSKVCFSPGGGQLLTASSDGTARIWSARDGKALQLLDGHTDEVFSCAFSYTGDTIVTASKDKTCRLWKMEPNIDDD